MTEGVTGVTGSEARSAAERQRASRARRQAQRLAEREQAARAPVQLAVAAQAEAELRLVEAALGDDQRGLALAERVLEGSRALILRLWGNPLLRLAETAATPVEELARRLQCERLDAARLQQEARRDVADRLFGRAPQAVKADGTPPVVVNLVATPGLVAALEIEADQRVTGEPTP